MSGTRTPTLCCISCVNFFFICFQVKLHYLSGLKELSQSVFHSLSDSARKLSTTSFEAIQAFGATTSKLRIDHYMKNDPELLTSLKCRMMQPRDYCVLLALQSEWSSKVIMTSNLHLSPLLGVFLKGPFVNYKKKIWWIFDTLPPFPYAPRDCS